MARLAAQGRAQLPVGTLMAVRAVRRRRMIRRIRAAGGVATGARHGDMRAFQGEAGPVVSGKRVDRRLPARCGVAILAAIPVRHGRELALVSILMAGGAGGEGHAIHGVLAFCRVTFRARHVRMFSE